MNQPETMRAAFLFHEGNEYHAYRFLGCHRRDNGYVFRVWAPFAKNVFLVGDFNSWSEDDPMSALEGTGFWECFVPHSRSVEGSRYKYRIVGFSDEFYKADPFAKSFALPPDNACVVSNADNFRWNDGAWMKKRKEKFSDLGARRQPVNIYEMRLDSWMNHADGSYPSYIELADNLAPYLLQMGFTHVELISPLACDKEGKLIGIYAADPRFGRAADFAAFVNALHRAGIGVILDWDIKGFSDEEQGLSRFDGSILYEKDNLEGDAPVFDFGRREVQSFLISNAVYFAEKLHIDGLRIKNIISLIYNSDGVVDRGALTLLRRVNGAMSIHYPDVIMMTDGDFADFPLTSSTAQGLGYALKWDLVCTRDTLSYAQMPLENRKNEIEELSAPLKHSFGEASILTLCEEDILNEGKSFISMMPGEYDEKFAQNRLFFTYMMTRPGKKLRFMGSEIAQFDIVGNGTPVQWFLTDYESHARFQLFCAELGRLYLNEKAFWELDCSPKGFSLDLEKNGIMEYTRFSQSGEEIKVILNFTPEAHHSYVAGVSQKGVYSFLLSTDSTRFAGGGCENGDKCSFARKGDSLKYGIEIDLPALGGVIFKYKANK